MKMTLDHTLALAAKAMVALAFRNGPIESVHAGSPCAVCCDNPAVSHISNEEMKAIMKSAVDTLYRLLWQRENDSAAYLGTRRWGNATPCNGMIQNSKSPG
jgi:hypothetical protein